MRVNIVAGVVASLLTPSVAFALSFPSRSEICVGDIVSKKKLAAAMLAQNTDAMKLFVKASDDSPGSNQPKWQRIFTDQSFCVNDPGCFAPSVEKKANGSDKPPLDDSAARDTLYRFRLDFLSALKSDVNGTHYAMANPNNGTNYLLGDDKINQIRCIGPDLPEPTPATKIASPVRLRANSDDLYINANGDAAQKNAFKNAKPATLTYTQDGVARSNTTKLQAAIGYPVPLPFSPTTFGYFDGEVVPFISATQTVTKSTGKATTYGDGNIVAAGALFHITDIFRDVEGLKNVLTAKPQYIWNTKDKSEIASVTTVYAPWTDRGFRINTDIPIGLYPDTSWLTPLFDVRDYVGEYTKVGIDPVTSLTNRSYHRAGTKFGFAFATPQKYGHIVLNVTETMLYGFTGSVRYLDLLESSLSLYFDSTNNFAFTLAYSKGRNVDTTERIQNWTAGLSAKF